MDRLSNELGNLCLWLDQVSPYATSVIVKLIGPNSEWRQIRRCVSQSYPKLIEFSSHKEPMVSINSDRVVVLRTKDWILYKIDKLIHVRWWRLDVDNCTWWRISKCQVVLHSQTDHSLKIALQGWIAFVCGERNDDLASHILIPEYSIEFAVEVFDEFYCEFSDYCSKCLISQSGGCEIITDILSLIACPSIEPSDAFQSEPPHIIKPQASGVILIALFRHILRQSSHHIKARGVKFLLPAIRRGLASLQLPRTHGLHARWYSLGALMPTLLSGLREWECELLTRVPSSPIESTHPNRIITKQQQQLLVVSNRLLNPSRWALELAIGMYARSQLPSSLVSSPSLVLCTSESFASYMTKLTSSSDVLEKKSPEFIRITRLAREEFLQLGGVCGCLQALPHLVRWNSEGAPRNIVVDTIAMKDVMDTENELCELLRQIRASDERTRQCLGYTQSDELKAAGESSAKDTHGKNEWPGRSRLPIRSIGRASSSPHKKRRRLRSIL